MTAMTIAKPMPGIAPRTATPAKQTIDSQNSQRWMRKIRTRSVISIKPIAEAITTAANAAVGRCCSRLGAANSSSATVSAPTTPVNCVWAPAASATGVRDALLLIGKPLKKSSGQIGRPKTNHFLIGVDMRTGSRSIGARKDAGVGERHHRDRETSDQNRDDIGMGDPWDRECRQALGKRTQHRHVRTRG